MARYFFHIKDGAELIKDPEGTELPTLHAARLQALASARELWADAIKSGKALGADAVVIADENGGMGVCAYERSVAQASRVAGNTRVTARLGMPTRPQARRGYCALVP